MKLEQSFDVQAPVETVWSALLDIEKIAPCLPGADITGHDDEGNYTGTFNIKLGPTNASYRGTLRIGEVDEAARRATLHARGTDKRGQGGANATIVNTLEAIDGGTRVHADTDFTITGRLASFSRSGMIKDISNRLLREFSSCLSETIAYDQEQTGAAPAAGAEESPVVGEAEAAAESAANAPDAPAPAPDAAGATIDEAAAAAGTAATPAPATPPSAGAAAGTAATSPSAGAAGAPGTPPPSTPAAGASATPPAAAPRQRPQAKEIKAGSLFFSVLWERIKRLFGRGS